MGLAITTPALVFYSQRVDGRPFVNCVAYSMCTVLRYMGYAVPRDYGMTIRKAAGVPVREGVGLSYAEINRALDKLLPDAPMAFSKLTEAQLLGALPTGSNGSVICVQARMERLPDGLRRFVGFGYVGFHGIALGGQRMNSGVQQVWWIDPMGKPGTGYAGEWTSWNAVKGALRKKLGDYDNGRARHGSAA